MKILMIAPTPFFSDRGCHVRIYGEAKALQKLGHTVVICTYHNGRDISGLPIKRIPNIPWYKKKEAGPSYHKIYLDLLLLVKSIIVAKKMNPDIIHAHLHEGCLIGFFLKKIVHRKLIFDYQGSLTEEMIAHRFISASGWKTQIIRKLEQKITCSADCILTSSQSMAQNLHNEGTLQNSKIVFARDGVDTDEFKPGRTSDQITTQLNLPKNKKIIGFLGILSTYQGIDCLLDAIVIIVQHRSDVHFLIMGFPDERKYQKMANTKGISEFVTFTGRINYSDTPKYLAALDIAVSPKLSTTEANLKLFSYIACGLPTIVFDSQINREILGNFGIYSKNTGDPSSFAMAIENALNNEQYLIMLRKELRDLAVTKYSWDAVAKTITDTYILRFEEK